MSSSQDRSPDPNPVLSAYESFQRDTPLVTRYVLTSLTLSYVLSYATDLTWPLQNMPLFTLTRLELYRLVLAPFVCTSLMSLIFAYISLTGHGKRLEHAMGSTAFGALILTIGTLTNIIYLILCVLGWAITKDIRHLAGSSVGIWTVLLGIISMECCTEGSPSHRNFFMFTVPTLYYPIALLVFIALLSGGLPLSYVISVGVGYAYGYKKFDRLKLGHVRRKRWEETVFRKFTAMEGWVPGPSDSEWNPINSEANNDQAWTPTMFRPSAAQPPASSNSIADTNATSFGGTGQTVGRPVQRSNIVNIPPQLSGNFDRGALLAAAADRRVATIALEKGVDEDDEEKGQK